MKKTEEFGCRRIRQSHQGFKQPAERCTCEAIAWRVLRGQTPAQISKWGAHGPNSIRQRFIDASSNITHDAKRAKDAGIVMANKHSTSLAPHQQQRGGEFGGGGGRAWAIRRTQSASGNLQTASMATTAVIRACEEDDDDDAGTLSTVGSVVVDNNALCCRHKLLWAGILAMGRAGFFTLFHGWAIALCLIADDHGQGLMHWSVAKEALHIVRELIKIGRNSETMKTNGDESAPISVDAESSEQPPTHFWATASDRCGVTPLHLAARLHSSAIIKILLTEIFGATICSIADDKIAGTSVAIADADGQTPLHYAAAAGSAACCELLVVGARHPTDVANKIGQTPLHYAALSSNGALVVHLLAGGKGLVRESRDRHARTPVHLAVQTNNLPVLQMLLDDLEMCPLAFDQASRTPLHYAALGSRIDAARLLITKGATNDCRDCYNVTPAHYAALNGSAELVYLLLSSTAFNNNRRFSPPSATVHQQQNNDNSRNSAQPPSSASAAGIVNKCSSFRGFKMMRQAFTTSPAVQALGRRASNASTGASATEQILMSNLQKKQQQPSDGVVGSGGARTLFDHIQPPMGGGVSAETTAIGKSSLVLQPMDSEGRSPFMWAIVGQNWELVKRMIDEKVVDVWRPARDVYRLTPLHLAALTGNEKVCHILVSANFFVLDTDKDGATPEHMAAGQGYANALLNLGFRRASGAPHPPDLMNRTPFFYACLGGQFHVVKKMLQSYKDIKRDDTDTLQFTALHCAAFAGSLPCVRLLVQEGFSPFAQTIDKKRPADVAADRGHYDIVRFLEESFLPPSKLLKSDDLKLQKVYY